MQNNNKDLTSITSFSKDEVLNIFRSADDPDFFKNRNTLFSGKILGSVFYCESTRTRAGFSSAFLRLGGQVIDFSRNSTHSDDTFKESYFDTGKIIGDYCDLSVVRLDEESEFMAFCLGSRSPCISAGYTTSEHPTQSLIDIYALYRCLKDINEANLLIYSSPKWGVITSLILGLGFWPSIKIHIVHPESDGLSSYFLERSHLVENEVRHYESLDDFYRSGEQKKINSVYVGAPNIALDEYSKAPIFNLDVLGKFPLSPVILSPLPRSISISPEVDSFDNAKYFIQSKWGLNVRGALLDHMANQID